MKFLPFDISTFAEIRTGKYIYVDKTEGIYNMYATGKRFHLLSRPRRFGKSLLASTISELFGGNRELFKGLWIDQEGRWEWVKHPVIYFDMSVFSTHTAQDFRISLIEHLKEMAQKLDIAHEKSTPEGILLTIVTELAQRQGKVVVCIDEYDKPLLDSLPDKEKTAQVGAVLKSFYDVFKSLSKMFRAIFITGVSTFSMRSIFSGFNNLSDISLSPVAATLVGYTKQEIVDNFGEHITLVSHQRDCTFDEIMVQMEEWYNGYRFSEDPISVFNPYSTMYYLESGRVRNYWFTTGTPTFLVPFLLKDYAKLSNLENIKISSQSLSVMSLAHIRLETLLFQTGYLTIDFYDKEIDKYVLKVPNHEVGASLNLFVMAVLSNLDTQDADEALDKLVLALKDNDLNRFFEVLQILLVHIPYEIHIKEEAYYHSLFYFLGILLNLRIDAELLTDKGRIDLVVATKTHIYLMELKINSTPAAALKQIHHKKYYERFMGDPRSIVLVGLNFTAKHSSLTIEWEKEEMLAVGPTSNVF